MNDTDKTGDTDNKGTIKVFVYGTLLKGHGAFGMVPVLKVQKDKLANFDIYNIGSFPGITPGDGEVVGEVHTIDKEDIKRLDSYEGVPSLYTRQEVTTNSGVNVYVYVFNRSLSNYERIEGGSWADRS